MREDLLLTGMDLLTVQLRLPLKLGLGLASDRGISEDVETLKKKFLLNITEDFLSSQFFFTFVSVFESWWRHIWEKLLRFKFQMRLYVV